METNIPISVTIETTVNAPVEKVWQLWTGAGHVEKWNSPSPDWHTTKSENDLRTGGKFSSRMEAKDGSMGFDFWGEHTLVEEHKHIASVLGDGRKMAVTFTPQGNATKVVETFDAENENPVEFQKAGWQAILDNFKKYAEEN